MRTQIRIQAARKTAEALVDRLSINSAPVDVNMIAKSLGLSVVYNDLGEDISGLLVSKGDTASICVREGEPLVRQRFTIAHEIGHFCLRHQFERGEHVERVHVDEGWKVTARSNSRTAGVAPMEVEANQFAAALLMPTRLLKQRAHRFSVRQLDDSVVSELAREFKVSEQAMAIRLDALGF
jgi:Zn-dependent peptidase ImmA (M78 family)